MKRYLSVFEMITRSSIYKVLGILLFMIVAESIALANAWNQHSAVYQPNLEEWVDQSYLISTFAITYFLITKVVSSSGTNVGSMQGYTLQRLRIPEKKVYLLQCVYNVLCYMLLWVAQLSVLLIASDFYMKYKKDVILTNQTVLLAFYRNEFMHSILPLEDIFGWYILFFLIVVTGVLAARFSRLQRRGQVAWSLVVFIVMAVFCFPREFGEQPVFIIMIAFIWTLYMLLQALLNKEVQENENEG